MGRSIVYNLDGTGIERVLSPATGVERSVKVFSMVWTTGEVNA